MADKKKKYTVKNKDNNKLKDTPYIIKNISSKLRNSIGLDLGTAITVAYVDKVGLLWNEPTLISINTTRNQIVSIGRRARIMLGRTPEHYRVVQPIIEGVISEYEIATHYISSVLKTVQNSNPKLLNPTVVVGIPCDSQPSEINAIKDAVIEAGARAVYIVYEPLGAAVGIGGLLETDKASMIIDIGGGTSDVIIIASGEIISKTTIRIAGNIFDKSIQESLESEKDLHVGIRTAENLKMAIMSGKSINNEIKVQGRGTQDGLPLELDITLAEVLRYIKPDMEEIVSHIKEFVSGISAEILTDFNDKNVYFVGGGPLIDSFGEMISKHTSLKLTIPSNHKTLSAMGNAEIASDPEKYKKYFI